jgi:O-antigen/teichoic acid export membrane protein
MKISLIKLLNKNSTKILLVATLGATALNFFGNVLNSKLLEKESFGDWKYLQSFAVLLSYIVNIGLYISGGRLIAASPTREKVRIYKGYLIYFALAGYAVIMLTALICGLFIPQVLNQNLFQLILFLFPFFIIHPLTFYFDSVYQGERRLLKLSIYRFVPSFLYICFLYSFKELSTGSIFYNAILYYCSFFIVHLLLIIHDKPIFKKQSPEWKDLQEQHRQFGFQLYMGGILNVGVMYLLPLLVGIFNINNTDVGLYSLALSFLMPLGLLASISGTSNYKKYIHAPHIPAKDFKKVILLSATVLVGLLLSVDFFIDLFLGAKYKEVGLLIKVGALGAILHGFADFVNKFLLAKGEAKYLMRISIICGITQLVSSLVLIKLYSAMGGIIAKSLGSLTLFSLLYLYYYKKYIIQKSEGHKIIFNEEEPQEAIVTPEIEN